MFINYKAKLKIIRSIELSIYFFYYCLFQQLLNENLNHQSVAKITGSSVCNGTIYARACVITNLSQAGEIQSGDILITRATDIGWSPYFPLLSGVVTELGGLISHGAVVAREYGLPCIVGAEGATRVFKTGN